MQSVLGSNLEKDKIIVPSHQKFRQEFGFWLYLKEEQDSMEEDFILYWMLSPFVDSA